MMFIFQLIFASYKQIILLSKAGLINIQGRPFKVPANTFLEEKVI